MSQVLLEGGPHDGRIITADRSTVTTVYVKQIPLPPERPDRPSPWRHPVRWFRWRRWTPPPQPMPEMQQLTYQDTGRTADGCRVYAIDGDWPWYRGPRTTAEGDLYDALVTAFATVHPMIRQDRQTRWVMDLAWYKQVRAKAYSRADPDRDEPDKWKPSPDDMLLGVPITVTEDGGAPHLENRRYPADWPD